MRDLLADRIAQLDNLYSISRDIRSKSLILSQMIALSERIDPDITESILESIKISNKEDIKSIKSLIREIIENSHIVMRFYNSDRDSVISECSKSIGSYIILMDTIRARLISELIERGYMRYMREIPIGLIREESEKHEFSIE